MVIRMERKFLIIPEFEQIQQTMELARQYDLGFEYNDFCYPKVYGDETEVQRRCEVYRQLDRDRSGDTLHGVFLDMAVTSQDPVIRQYSRQRVEQSMEIADRLGVRGVVFHTGLIGELQTDSYLKPWLEESEKFWHIMALRYPGIDIYMENTFEKSPDILLKLCERMSDVKNFKLCFDYGHACLTPLPVDSWAGKMGTHAGHIHLNDNDNKADLHQVPGEGKLDFGKCKRLLETYFPGLPVLLELTGIEAQKRALEYMRNL